MADSNLPAGVVRVRVNDDRARTLGLPLLRSIHPDGRLVGYSIYGADGIDLIVETHQLLVAEGDLSPFTTRSMRRGDDDELQWSFHALDHLQNGPSQTPRDALVAMIRSAPRAERDVRVDGRRVPSTAFEVLGSTFTQVHLAGDAVITIAAPEIVVAAGFSTLTE